MVGVRGEIVRQTGKEGKRKKVCCCCLLLVVMVEVERQDLCQPLTVRGSLRQINHGELVVRFG